MTPKTTHTTVGDHQPQAYWTSAVIRNYSKHVLNVVKRSQFGLVYRDQNYLVTFRKRSWTGWK